MLKPLLSSLFFFCCFHGFGQHLSPQELQNSVDSIVTHVMNEAEIPGLAVGIVQSDSILIAKGYGLKDINENEAVTEHSVFHTASISKLFTAMAIMQLVNEEKLALEAKLLEILPELNCTQADCEKITVKSLLNHTSGLPDINNYNWKNNNQSEESLKNYLSSLKLKLQHPPFTTYYYSNLGYDILGGVIERINGQPFEEYVKLKLLLPAGISASDFRYFKIADSLRTTPHTKNRLSSAIKVRKTYPYTREHAPSSTLNASAYELSKWMISFLQGLDDDSGSYDEMLQPSVPGNPYIGLGFQLGEIHGFKKVGHYGGDRGFRSYLFLIPERKAGFVLLANCDYNEDFRQDILHRIAGLLLK